MLDIRILTAEQLALGELSFVAVFLLGWLVVRLRPAWLRSLRATQPIFYAGVGLVVVVGGLSVYVLPLRLGLGLMVAGLAILIGGTLDEKKSLRPWTQLVWQLVAIISVLSAGWTIPYVTNPWQAGVVALDWYQLGWWIFPGSLLAALWLLAVMNAVNWTDGVDGLSATTLLVAFATLAIISLLPATQDTPTLQLALIGGGATLGFLLWNWSPARLYLGTVGSWWLGLYVGVVAMLGGGKIATTLLVLAIPLLDALIVIALRLRHQQLPWQGGDRRHVHDLLQAQGFSARRICAGAFGISCILSTAAITLATPTKIIIFSLVALIFTASLATLRRYGNQNK